MSTIANMPKVKEALDNLREVLETERRDRIEFLRSCIGSWRADIERAEKLPEQIARSAAEIAELERMRVPDHTSLVPVVGDSHGPVNDRVCPGCRKYVPIRQLEPKPDEYADEVDGKKILVVFCDACRAERGSRRMKNDPFADLRNHIQELTDTAARRERQLMDENASLLNQLNAAQTELRDGVGKVKEKAAAREAEIAERLAALLGNVNLACYGVDDLVGRLRDELADLDWMSSAKRMAGG